MSISRLGKLVYYQGFMVNGKRAQAQIMVYDEEEEKRDGIAYPKVLAVVPKEAEPLALKFARLMGIEIL